MVADLGVVLHIGHPHQFHLRPVDIAQILRAVGDLALEGRDPPAVADGGEQNVEFVLTAFGAERAQPVRLEQVGGGRIVRRHLEDGHQSQIAAGIVQVAHVALFIVRPIEGRGGIAQMGLILGLHLEFDVLVAVEGAAALGTLQ